MASQITKNTTICSTASPALWDRNLSVTDEFPSQRAGNTESVYVNKEMISIVLVLLCSDRVVDKAGKNHGAVRVQKYLSIAQWRPDMETPDSKVHGANIWGLQDPGGPHVGPMNLAIWDGFRITGSWWGESMGGRIRRSPEDSPHKKKQPVYGALIFSLLKKYSIFWWFETP